MACHASPERPNFPDALKAAGYETYHHGKSGNTARLIHKRFDHTKYVEHHNKLRNGEPELAATLMHRPAEDVGPSDAELLPEPTQRRVEQVLTWILDQGEERVSAGAVADHFSLLVGWPGKAGVRALVRQCLDQLGFLTAVGNTKTRRLQVSEKGVKWLTERVL